MLINFSRPVQILRDRVRVLFARKAIKCQVNKRVSLNLFVKLEFTKSCHLRMIKLKMFLEMNKLTTNALI